MAAHMAGREAKFRMDVRIIVRGEIRWVAFTFVSRRDASGKPVRWTGSSTDITERKRAAEALRLSDERYAFAMEAAEAGHSDWNLETGQFYISPRLLEICGHPPGTRFANREDWVRRTPFHPEDRPRWAAAVAAHMAGRESKFRMDVRLIVRGEIRWAGLTFVSRRDASGKPVRWTGTSTDITERKRAEAALRSRQEMLELAQRAARAVAFELPMQTVDGKYHWSPELEALHGLAPGSYDGSFRAWKKLVHREDWPAVRKAILHANKTGDADAEYRVIQPGSEMRWLQAKGRMLFDAEGRPERLVGFILDVTDRHAAEEELRRLEHQLRQAQRLEAMGTLAGGIAHDFNNILGAILGFGEMAMAEAPKNGRLQRDLLGIRAACERGRALVERILTFSRSSVGERVPVHVEQVIREALDLVTVKLPENLTVEASLRSGRAAILGDPTQVHQILMNLVTNAAHAMPGGGLVRVSLDVRMLDAERVVTTGRLKPGVHVVLEVADNGVGMAPGVLERIFDPFFSTKEVGVGTGLGLSLVHGIVAEVGGAIEVATEVGKGSVFTIYLPRSGDAAEDRSDDHERIPRGEQQRVLVVDDEEPLVHVATRTLAALGYAPVGFTSSSAALEAFRAAPAEFDAVITDERMPGLSGSALIAKVRGIRRDIPILLVSGYVGGKILDRAFNAGADEVLKKPLSVRELAISLARVLQA